MKSTIGMSRGDKVFYTISYIVAALIVLVTLYPIYFVVIASFSNANSVALGKVVFWPSDIEFTSYQRVINHKYIWISYKNTIVYTVSFTLLSVIATMLAAFVFSRRNLKGSRVCMFAVLFTMYFNGGMIPNYFNIKMLGMLNTAWAMIIPGIISCYNLIIARTYIQTNIPEALNEAATIDGCSPMRYFVKIVMPLSAPIIGVLALYCAVGQWNSYFNAPLISDRS